MALTKIFEQANDQHLRNVVVYGKAADSKIYEDSAYTTQVDQAVVEDAFAKGMLLVKAGDDYFVPIAISANKVLTVALTGSPAALAGTEWASKATE